MATVFQSGAFQDTAFQIDAAGGNVTITCLVGDASATGVNALLPRSIVGTVADASAIGIAALVSRSIAATVADASAVGFQSLISRSIQAAIGDASATGVTALITAGSGSPVTITATVGDASAVGVSALLNVSTVSTVGDASATGVVANITVGSGSPVTITCGVADASAIGVSSLVNKSLITTTGEASATGVSAVVSIVSNDVTITASVGNSVADGIPARILGLFAEPSGAPSYELTKKRRNRIVNVDGTLYQFKTDKEAIQFIEALEQEETKEPDSPVVIEKPEPEREVRVSQVETLSQVFNQENKRDIYQYMQQADYSAILRAYDKWLEQDEEEALLLLF